MITIGADSTTRTIVDRWLARSVQWAGSVLVLRRMPDPASLLPGLLIAATAAILLWFTFGTQRNIRRGNRLLAWLQDGLPELGPRTTLRWLGSSVAELAIVQPRHPFREALLMVVLEPRDVGALWALTRSRGRRDFFVLRLSLLRAPTVRADLVAPRAWTATDRRRDDHEPEHEASWTDAAGAAVRIRHDGRADLDELRRGWDRLAERSGGMWRISVRPVVPHLEVHLLPPDPETAGARPLLHEVAELARALSRP